MSRSDSNYLSTLDGWRAVAISMVLVAHASRGAGITLSGDYFAVPGVQVFFGLSGFLITTLLLRQESRSNFISLTRFYARRVFRIVPAASVFLVVVGVLGILGLINITFGRWVSALFFVANYARGQPNWYVQHFWSLAVEEHFYLLWPAVLIVLKGLRKRLAVAVTAAILIAIWRLIDFKYRWFWPGSAFLWSHRTDVQADNILWGAAFALALADAGIAPRIRTLLRQPATSFGAIAVYVLTCGLTPHVSWKYGLLLLSIRAAVVPIMVLSTFHKPGGVLGTFLEHRLVRFVGLISYSLYLWQELFLVWEPNPRLANVQWFPFNLVMAFLCATLSYRYVETPLIRLGHALSARWASSRRSADVGALQTN